jgi:hypothetical protein
MLQKQVVAYFKVLSLHIAGVMEGDQEESKSIGSWSLGGIQSQVFMNVYQHS